MEEAISQIVACAATVTSGMVIFWMKRFFNAQRRKEEEKESEKERDGILILRSIHALGKLTVANSMALRDGKTNGEMSTALSEYEKVEQEMYDHLIAYHAKNTSI